METTILNTAIKAESTASLAAEITDHVLRNMPAEKNKAVQDMAATGKVLQAEGSVRTREGLGQKLGSVPARLYHRWNQLLPGCWKEKDFFDEFMIDNPQCRAPGWTPKPRGLRHGFTFVDGKPVGATNGYVTKYHELKHTVT